MKLLKEEVADLYLMPDDSIQVTYTEPGQPTRVVVEHTVDTVEHIDVARIYKIEPGELGLAGGYAGVLGKKA